MDAVTILEKYKQLTVKEYEVRQEMDQLTSSIRDEKLLCKYNVRLDNYSFTIYYIADKGKACLIPLDDLKKIEDLTNSKLTSMNNYNYHFTWIHEIIDDKTGDLNG